MKFSQITESLLYPIKQKANLSTLHAEIISYTIEHFFNSAKFKRTAIATLNTVSYYITNGDSLPAAWNTSDPFQNIELIDDDICSTALGALFIRYDDVKWDIEESEKPSQNIRQTGASFISKQQTPTPKEDLYIKPPMFPQFDYSKPWLNINKDGEQYVIYTSLPIIPQNQSQISVTTNVDIMTKTDLLKLFPNQLIRTRAQAMYEPYNGLEFDDRLGVIFPISGFTLEQVRDNIIQYPHFYKLKRFIKGEFVSFYSNIEIDGELYDTLEIWDSLPESKVIPRTSEFIKEYVVRRYLLERDILGIEHKYPMYGTLEPFLTLFSTPEDYCRFGYPDPAELAAKCVKSRISYKQSRNPIIRKVMDIS